MKFIAHGGITFLCCLIFLRFQMKNDFKSIWVAGAPTGTSPVLTHDSQPLAVSVVDGFVAHTDQLRLILTLTYESLLF